VSRQTYRFTHGERLGQDVINGIGEQKLLLIDIGEPVALDGLVKTMYIFMFILQGFRVW